MRERERDGVGKEGDSERKRERKGRVWIERNKARQTNIMRVDREADRERQTDRIRERTRTRQVIISPPITPHYSLESEFSYFFSLSICAVATDIERWFLTFLQPRLLWECVLPSTPPASRNKISSQILKKIIDILLDFFIEDGLVTYY